MNDNPLDEIRSILKEMKGIMFWLEVGWFWGLCLFAATLLGGITSLCLRIKIDTIFWFVFIFTAFLPPAAFLLLKKRQKKCVGKN